MLTRKSTIRTDLFERRVEAGRSYTRYNPVPKACPKSGLEIGTREAPKIYKNPKPQDPKKEDPGWDP